MTDWNQEPYLGRGATNIPVSNSEIQTFKENRREWWLKYYRGLTPIKKTVEGPLPLGTRVHFALEMMYGQGRDPLEAYFEQLKRDRILFDASSSGMNDDRIKKFDSDAELGRRMIEGYVEWIDETGADAAWEIVDVEKEVTYPMIDGRIMLRGKVDMKVRDVNDGARLAVDHKTAINFKMFHDISHMSEQLMTYTLLEKLQDDDDDTAVEGGVYNLLKKVKRSPKANPPFYERITVRFNQASLNNFWTRLHGTLYDMLRVRDALDEGADPQLVAYPTINQDLVWKSDFFPVYHLLDDGSNAEAWLRDFTVVHDPYARYNTNDEE